MNNAPPKYRGNRSPDWSEDWNKAPSHPVTNSTQLFGFPGVPFMHLKDKRTLHNFISIEDTLDENGEAQKVKVIDAGEMGLGLVARESIRTGERIFGIMRSDVFINKIGGAGEVWAYRPNNIVVDIEEEEEEETFGDCEHDTSHWAVRAEPHKNNPLTFLNHSCDPNAVRFGPYIFVAKRDIAEGEPITADYAFLEVDDFMNIECKCGSVSCRGKIEAGLSNLPLKDIMNNWVDLPQFMQKYFLGYWIETHRGEVLRMIKETLGEIGL